MEFIFNARPSFKGRANFVFSGPVKEHIDYNRLALCQCCKFKVTCSWDYNSHSPSIPTSLGNQQFDYRSSSQKTKKETKLKTA